MMGGSRRIPTKSSKSSIIRQATTAMRRDILLRTAIPRFTSSEIRERCRPCTVHKPGRRPPGHQPGPASAVVPTGKEPSRTANWESPRASDPPARTATDRLVAYGNGDPEQGKLEADAARLRDRVGFLGKDVDDLLIRRKAHPEVVTPVAPALPAAEVSPRSVKNLAYPAVIGLILGLCLALLQEFLDERIHSHGPGAPLGGLANSGWKLAFSEAMNDHQRAKADGAQ